MLIAVPEIRVILEPPGTAVKFAFQDKGLVKQKAYGRGQPRLLLLHQSIIIGNSVFKRHYFFLLANTNLG